MQTRQKQIRLEAGLSLTAAAALAGVSPGTYRAFEINADAVTEQKRAPCDAAVEKMAAMPLKKAS